MDYELQRRKLVDEKSKIYYDARRNYIKDKRLSTFYKNIRKTKEQYRLREVDEFASRKKISSWIVWGMDDYTLYNYLLLIDCGYNVIAVGASKSPSIKELEKIYTPVENICHMLCSEEIGLIVNERDLSELPAAISDRDNILVVYSHIVGRTGWQYFDFFSPDVKECFIDGGSLDAESSKDFIKWCNSKYESIYAFEPNPIMVELCRANLNRCNKDIIFYEYALWSDAKKLNFDNSGSKWDARVNVMGSNMVKGNSIDNLLRDKRITFIKLDIEGSEMEALKGAKECIVKNNPRMAISVYHNENDLFDIIDYLYGLVPKYHFAIRHYHSDCIETVLYVYV